MPFLRIPHIRQKGDVDCLIACAAMMLAAVDVHIDYKRLRTLLGVTDIGTPFSRLPLLSRIQSDLRVTLRKGHLQQLRAAIDAGVPPAVFVFTEDLPYWHEAVSHAVLLVGYTSTDFYINDPEFAAAPQVASIGDLELAWIEHDSHFAVVQRSRRSR
jgi:ABC-type bacteriocin/lantibiotic exporter with double-glycine peptidase domain